VCRGGDGEVHDDQGDLVDHRGDLDGGNPSPAEQGADRLLIAVDEVEQKGAITPGEVPQELMQMGRIGRIHGSSPRGREQLQYPEEV
jgi:hypothetical protein